MPRNLIDITDLSVEEINQLIATAEDIIANPVKYQDACAHKQLATLFFEPSTRTRLSFESAMLALGAAKPIIRRVKSQLHRQGRDRGRHHPHCQLLRRHHRHAPSQGGCSLRRLPVQ